MGANEEALDSNNSLGYSGRTLVLATGLESLVYGPEQGQSCYSGGQPWPVYVHI